MKRIKSFLTVVMATIFALSLVPAGAWADTVNGESGTTSGVLGGTGGTGTISIDNAKIGEEYELYRIFDLASFEDKNTANDRHGDGTYDKDEAYSYVIKADSPWLTFLEQYGPKGLSDTVKYAVKTGNVNYGTLAQNAYFIINSEPVTIKGIDEQPTQYLVVTPQKQNFNNDWDYIGTSTAREDNGAQGSTGAGGNLSGETEEAGSRNYNKVQDFAQAALKYAQTTSNNVSQATYMTTDETPTLATYATKKADAASLTLLTNAPLGYYLVGTTMGALASLDTSNRDVTLHEKNDEPTIDKKVLKKGSIAGSVNADYLTGGVYSTTGTATANWVTNTDADINDYVQFRTVVTAQQGAKGYKLHDVMEAGLEFVQGNSDSTQKEDRYKNADGSGEYGQDYDLKVYLVRTTTTDEGQEAQTTKTVYSIPSSVVVTEDGTTKTASNWTLTATGLNDGCDFELTFDDGDGADYDGKYAVRFGAQLLNQTNGTVNGSATWVEVQDNDQIVVTYWAKVKDTGDAAIYKSETAGSSSDQSAIHYNTDETGNTLGESFQMMKTHDNNGRNDNGTVLTYGARAYTQLKKASVTTYQFDLVKTNAQQGTSNVYDLLKDAKFKIYKAEKTTTQNEIVAKLGSDGFKKESANALVFDKDTANNVYYFTGDKNADTSGTPRASTTRVNELASMNNHEIHLEGLEAGFYLLEETEAPAGYNKLAHPIVIQVKEGPDDRDSTTVADEGKIKYESTLNNGSQSTDGASFKAWDATIATAQGATKSTYDTSANSQGGVHIINNAGQELPSTGGIGTTIFYVAGTVLVVGAAVMLVAKRRMGSEA